MDTRIMLVAAALAAGLLMVGCSTETQLASAPERDIYYDRDLWEDEWDDDAPNWAQPVGGTAESPHEALTVARISYLAYGLDEDEWDEDAPNWRHSDDLIAEPPGEATARAQYPRFDYGLDE